MSKKDYIEKIENKICDLNYYINYGTGNEKQEYAWKYARETLQNFLKIAELLD